MAKKLTKRKAKKILKEGVAHGKKLTAKQKKFFGAITGGKGPRRKTKRKHKKKSIIDLYLKICYNSNVCDSPS